MLKRRPVKITAEEQARWDAAVQKIKDAAAARQELRKQRLAARGILWTSLDLTHFNQFERGLLKAGITMLIREAAILNDAKDCAEIVAHVLQSAKVLGDE